MTVFKENLLSFTEKANNENIGSTISAYKKLRKSAIDLSEKTGQADFLNYINHIGEVLYKTENNHVVALAGSSLLNIILQNELRRAEKLTRNGEYLKVLIQESFIETYSLLPQNKEQADAVEVYTVNGCGWIGCEVKKVKWSDVYLYEGELDEINDSLESQYNSRKYKDHNYKAYLKRKEEAEAEEEKRRALADAEKQKEKELEEKKAISEKNKNRPWGQQPTTGKKPHKYIGVTQDELNIPISVTKKSMDYTVFNKENSSNKDFKTPETPKKIDHLATKEKILGKHGIDSSTKDNQAITAKKVIDLGTPSSGGNSDDIATLKNRLFALKQANNALFNDYKEMKLDLEKAKWNEFYTPSASLQQTQNKADELDSNASEISRVRGILDGSNSLSDSERQTTVPYVANGRSVNSYVDNNLASYRAANAKAVADNIAKIEKSLANTKSSVNYYRLEYSYLLKRIDKVRTELKAANFKPTEDNKDVVADSKKEINQLKADADKALAQANIYIRKQSLEEKDLAYAKIDQFRYDGKSGTYQSEKSGLDQTYAGVTPTLIATEPLNSSYNELMAILGQPIVPKDLPSYRGVISTAGKMGMDYEYIETAENSDLKTSGKRNVLIHTRFGKEGLKNENVMTGDKEHFGSYEYTAIGKWSSPGNEFTYINDENQEIRTIPAEQGYWVLGQVADLPKTGSAAYLGDVIGYLYTGTNSYEKLHGDIGLKATFADKKIAGKMSIKRSDGSDYAKLGFSNSSIGIDKTQKNFPDALKNKDFSNYFEGNLISYDDHIYGGDLVGAFYGPNAAEVGGGWEIWADSSNASGVFRAKKTSQNSDLIPNNPNEVLKIWGGWTSMSKSGFTGATIVRGHSPIANGKVTVGNGYESNKDTVSVDYDNYNYVAWGSWETNYNGQAFKQVVYGQLITINDMPKIGSATYKGNLQGDYMNTATGAFEQSTITGNISLTADFSENKIRGIMNARHNGELWAPAVIKPTIINENKYHADIVITENRGVGKLMGEFYGPNAQETGGVFNIDKGTEYSAGTFRAKKQ